MTHRCCHRFCGQGCPGGVAPPVLRPCRHGSTRHVAIDGRRGVVVGVGACALGPGDRGAVRPPPRSRRPRRPADVRARDVGVVRRHRECAAGGVGAERAPSGSSGWLAVPRPGRVDGGCRRDRRLCRVRGGCAARFAAWCGCRRAHRRHHVRALAGAHRAGPVLDPDRRRGSRRWGRALRVTVLGGVLAVLGGVLGDRSLEPPSAMFATRGPSRRWLRRCGSSGSWGRWWSGSG